MSYYITEQKANFICDCGYEKNGITVKAAETVRRLHEKVCPNQKIKVRLTEKPKGVGAAELPSMYETCDGIREGEVYMKKKGETTSPKASS
jgi:hypothetical protein